MPRPVFGPQALEHSPCEALGGRQHLPGCRCPQAMLLRTPARVAIFGGGAGGGKSYVGLLQAMRWRQINGYRCGFFRLDRPRLTQEGGLWDESKLIYPYFGGQPNSQRLEWGFPSGAKIKLNGLQGDFKLASKDGAQIPVIQYDELQEFSRRMFTFMFTRNRSQVAGVPRIIRGYCNPDPDGAAWLSEFLGWYWDPDTGYSIPERSGVIRWFVYVKNKFHWADTREELLNAFPGEDPISATFIRSLVQDNPILLRNNPDYLAALQAQDEITREIKLLGNWKIRASKGSRFNRAWMPMIEYTPINATRVRYWDLAGTDEDSAEEKGSDPDWTVGLRLARCNVTGQFFVEDVIRVRMHPMEVRQLILNTAITDGEMVRVRVEFEGGSHTKYVEHDFTQMLEGFDVAFVRATRSKTIRADAVSAQCKARNVCVKIGGWNEDFFNEIEIFPKTGRRIHDDQVDAFSGAFNELMLVDRDMTDDESEATARMIAAGIRPVEKGRFGR